MAKQVTVEGLKEFRRFLKKMPPEVRKELGQIGKKAAQPVADTARQIAPKISGDLRDSIRVLAGRGGSVAAGSTRVPYAGPIHYGWPARNIQPQPFLINALAMRQSAALVIFDDEVALLTDRLVASLTI